MLVVGVNMPDHNVMFGNLASQLKDRVTPHVAILRSKDCSNIKSIMAKTLSQIMQNNDIVSALKLHQTLYHVDKN